MNTKNQSYSGFENLLKATEVAEILGISRAFAYKLMKEGKIPSVEIGNARRVRPSDLQKYILTNLQYSEG